MRLAMFQETINMAVNVLCAFQVGEVTAILGNDELSPGQGMSDVFGNRGRKESNRPVTAH